MISEWRGPIVLYCLAAQHYFVPRWEKWLPSIVNFLTMMNSLRLGYQKLKAAIDFISTFSTGHGWTHPLQLMIAENKWVAINIFWGLNEIKKCRPVGCRLQAAGLIKTMHSDKISHLTHTLLTCLQIIKHCLHVCSGCRVCRELMFILQHNRQWWWWLVCVCVPVSVLRCDRPAGPGPRQSSAQN